MPGTRRQKIAQTQALAAAFAERHGSYDGWTFEFMYPGFFAYHHPDRPVTVFFTPDHSEEGEIDIAVEPEPGVQKGLAIVSYEPPLQPDDLFASVKGWLDRYR
jgi:hypothetical protein